MRPADLALFRTLGNPTLSPDGRHAVVSVSHPDLEADDYRAQLWIIPTDGGADPRPLTHGWRDTCPAYSPDGRWIAFLRAGQGAVPQLYVMPTQGGEPRRITDHALGAGEPVWSPDSTRIAYVARVPEEGRYGTEEGVTPEKEPPRRIAALRYRLDNLGFVLDRHAQVFVLDALAEEPEPRQVTNTPVDHSGVVWSPDASLLCFSAPRPDEDDQDLVVDVWVCRPDGSGVRRITRGVDQPLHADTPDFAPDGESVYFVARDLGVDGLDFIGKNEGLWTVPVDGSAPPLRLTDPERYHRAFPAVPITVAEDGVLFHSENRGAVELLLVPHRAAVGDEPRRIVAGPRQVQGSDSAAGVVVATVAGPDTPGELVAVTEGGESVLTSFNSRVRATARPMTEITGTAPDGYPVHGWIVRPDGPGPHPVLLMIHGGPFTQYGWTLFDEAQVYAGAGYAVVYGNPRGSSGYGERHGRHIVGDVGRRSATDLLALLDAALEAGDLDGDRVGVLGGSHGGFMTTWMAAHHGDRFRAAISERAVNAIDSFLGSSDIGWSFAEVVYGSDPEGRAAQSPLTYVHRIDIPVLIIHSEQDWRCPLEQAQRLFVALKKRGVPTEMLLFPGEGHELSRSGLPSHRVARFDAILDWWARHLKAA